MSTIKDKINFLYKVFGPVILASDGLHAGVECPKCGKSASGKKKVTIRLDNDNYHCWVCDLKGKNLSNILRKFRPQYLAEYHERFLGKKINESLHPLPENTEVKIPPNFMLLAANLKSKDPDVQAVIKYARSRGLSDRDFWFYKLGTCQTGRFRRRLIIPSFDDTGNLNYFVGRAITADPKMKYLNSKASKKQVIFNEINIDWRQELTIVEGPMDLIKCDTNSTCILGSQFNENYLLFQKIIKNSTPVILALDPDAIDKAVSYAKKLSTYGISVKMLNIGSHEDVGAMSKEQFAIAKKDAMEWSDSDRLYHLIKKIRSGSLF